MLNLSKFAKSMGYAFRGLVYVFKSEQNFRIQCVGALVVLAAISFFNISLIESAILVLVIIMVLILELFNTVTEKFIDILKPRLHSYVEVIKDIMAAAVLVASMGAVIIGLLIIGPHLLQFLLKIS